MYVNKWCNLQITYFLTVLLSIPSKKLPCWIAKKFRTHKSQDFFSFFAVGSFSQLVAFEREIQIGLFGVFFMSFVHVC